MISLSACQWLFGLQTGLNPMLCVLVVSPVPYVRFIALYKKVSIFVCARVRVRVSVSDNAVHPSMSI